MISDTAGSKAKPYFPFIFSLFMFVLFCNMVGMLPYSFTVTSHIIVTLIMALFINGVNLMHHLNRCRLILQKHKLEETQLKFLSQSMLLKN